MFFLSQFFVLLVLRAPTYTFLVFLTFLYTLSQNKSILHSHTVLISSPNQLTTSQYEAFPSITERAFARLAAIM